MLHHLWPPPFTPIFCLGGLGQTRATATRPRGGRRPQRGLGCEAPEGVWSMPPCSTGSPAPLAPGSGKGPVFPCCRERGKPARAPPQRLCPRTPQPMPATFARAWLGLVALGHAGQVARAHGAPGGCMRTQGCSGARLTAPCPARSQRQGHPGCSLPPGFARSPIPWVGAGTSTSPAPSASHPAQQPGREGLGTLWGPPGTGCRSPPRPSSAQRSAGILIGAQAGCGVLEQGAAGEQGQSDGSSWAGSSILIDIPKKAARRQRARC